MDDNDFVIMDALFAEVKRLNADLQEEDANETTERNETMESNVLKAVEEISGYTPKEMIAMYDDYERMANECEAYAALGTVEELAALKEAKDDGRLVMLPCKRGDTAYRLCGPKGRRRIVERPVTSVEFNGPVTIIHSTADDVLGKTVFLTRDEAEKALWKEQDER